MLRRMRQKNQVFKAIIDYLVSSRAIKGDLVSKTTTNPQQKNKILHTLKLHTKTNSTFIKDLNERPERL